jgi:hypothetical protein
LEEKHTSLSDKVGKLEAEKIERVAEVTKLNTTLTEREKDIEELQM